MQYAILYVDSPPFVIGPADWPGAINEWLGYMSDPAYMQVNGKPLFHVIDMRQMRQAFGSATAVSGALNQLRAAAQARGLAGVYIVGGFGVPDGSSGQDGLFPDLTPAFVDGYDAVSMYNYPFAPPVINGALPFSSLAGAGKWIWSQGVLKSPVPFIPVSMTGWDPRPWDEREFLTNDLMWFSRSPQEVSTFASDAITWAESNPQLRPEPSPAPPIVVMEAWNELGEGSYVIPTVGDGTSYGDSLAAMLAAPPTRSRVVVTVSDSGPADPNRTASGKLSDAAGAPISGATITLTETPASGVFAQYQLSGSPPAATTQAVVGFRVNMEVAGPEPSDFSLYGARLYSDRGRNRAGRKWELLIGNAILVLRRTSAIRPQRPRSRPDDAGACHTEPDCGVDFFRAIRTDIRRCLPSLVFRSCRSLVVWKWLLRGHLPQRRHGDFATGNSIDSRQSHVRYDFDGFGGNYQVGLTSLGASRVILETSYASDAQHWPGYARVGP
jgi:hypothetical protein